MFTVMRVNPLKLRLLLLHAVVTSAKLSTGCSCRTIAVLAL